MVDMGFAGPPIPFTVAVNLGIFIDPSRAVILEAMIGNLCAVRVSNLNLHHMNYMLYLPNAPLSSAADGFRRFLSGRLDKREKAADFPALAASQTRKNRSRGKEGQVQD